MLAVMLRRSLRSATKASGSGDQRRQKIRPPPGDVAGAFGLVLFALLRRQPGGAPRPIGALPTDARTVDRIDSGRERLAALEADPPPLAPPPGSPLALGAAVGTHRQPAPRSDRLAAAQTGNRLSFRRHDTGRVTARRQGRKAAYRASAIRIKGPVSQVRRFTAGGGRPGPRFAGRGTSGPIRHFLPVAPARPSNPARPALTAPDPSAIPTTALVFAFSGIAPPATCSRGG